MNIRVEFFGSLTLISDGIRISIDGQVLRSIVAIIAARQGNPIGRDELIEELGLAATSRNAANALHAHIARLRRSLRAQGVSANLIETRGAAGYRIAVGRDDIDTFRFLDGVHRASEIAPSAPLVVSEMLEDALRLWRRGPFLDVADSPFIRAMSEDLHAARSVAQELLLDAWIELERYDRVILDGRRFVSENPLHEPMWESLISGFRRAGRDADAVASYLQLKRILRDELGISPNERLARTVRDLDCA
ncbi:winged helix-turn-helix domain-containing protein [Nocardia cyriacigeorgica]|uniref:AfsR/SARP family transcriptional regulator n=1 Tax=Nocardia cyriacigeorgica TaxID=135487 RepID=UPI0018945955|nr:BTAD domain-containing putative transcriptional regulator [Nocardia cyriacigeorgica]MBF6082352.1 winged helix-turn-helix domain-containing protein [Nocardia cyriacigeorgica]